MADLSSVQGEQVSIRCMTRKVVNHDWRATVREEQSLNPLHDAEGRQPWAYDTWTFYDRLNPLHDAEGRQPTSSARSSPRQSSQSAA